MKFPFLSIPRFRTFRFVVPGLALLLCSLVRCAAKPPAESSREIGGTQLERVAAISQLVGKHAPLPSKLLDAHFLEQQVGDGIFGASDFSWFYAFTVAQTDLPAWRAALIPIPANRTPPEYAAPKKPLPWWLTPADFASLKFYDPKLLTGRSNGWIGIAPDSGKIYVYVFTM